MEAWLSRYPSRCSTTKVETATSRTWRDAFKGVVEQVQKITNLAAQSLNCVHGKKEKKKTMSTRRALAHSLERLVPPFRNHHACVN